MTRSRKAQHQMAPGGLPPIHHLRFHPRKALAAIALMLRWAAADGRGPADLHALLKACYFADKKHLNRHWRPVFGATYRAMAYGPVPLEIYELLKADPYRLEELGLESLPWRIQGYYVFPTTDADPDRRHLSDSDIAALRDGFQLARQLTFNERTAESHDRAWQRARHGLLDYADMVDADNPDREAILEALYEDSHGWSL
jgi:hypothetical protein